MKKLLFIHGFPFCRTIWNDVVKIIGERIRCVAIDMPGYGEEPPLPSFTISHLAMWIHDKHIKGEKNWIIAGHSMGGYVSLAIADIYPELVDKIILVHSHPLEDDVGRRRGRYASIPKIINNTDAFVEESVSRVSPNYKHLVINHVKYRSPDVLVNSVIAMAERPNRIHILHEKPTLIIDGSDDTFLPREKVKNEIVDRGIAEYRCIEGAAHMSMIEKPEELAYAILQFVEK